MHVELWRHARPVLVQEEQADRGERGRERVDVPTVELFADDLAKRVLGRVALGAVQIGEPVIQPGQEVPGPHAGVEHDRVAAQVQLRDHVPDVAVRRVEGPELVRLLLARGKE